MSKITHRLLSRLSRWLPAGSRVEEHYLGADREVFALRLLPPGKPKGGVLFVHGTGNDAVYPYISLLLNLVADGWVVAGFDLCGHGHLSSTSFGVEELSECVEPVLEQLMAPLNLPSIHLLGHSLGGLVSLMFLVKGHPIQPQSAILLSVPLREKFHYGMLAPELGAVVDREVWEQSKYYGFWGLLPAFGSFKRRDYPIRMREAGSGMGYVRVVADFVKHVDYERIAPELRLPVLCLYGDKDAIAPAADGESLALRLPQGHLVKIKGGNHFSLPFKSETNEVILEWLSKWSHR